MSIGNSGGVRGVVYVHMATKSAARVGLATTAAAHLVQRRAHRSDQLFELPDALVHLDDAPRFRDVHAPDRRAVVGPRLPLPLPLPLPLLILILILISVPALVLILPHDHPNQPAPSFPPPPHLLQPPPHVHQPADHLPRVDRLPVLLTRLQRRVGRILELRFECGELGLERAQTRREGKRPRGGGRGRAGAARRG